MNVSISLFLYLKINKGEKSFLKKETEKAAIRNVAEIEGHSYSPGTPGAPGS